MKITLKALREMIKESIHEQFTIPLHSNHSGFELYTETEEEDQEDETVDEQGTVPPSLTGDDIRAGEGGPAPFMYTESKKK